MTKEVSKQVSPRHRRELGMALAMGLALFIGLVTLNACSKNSANSNAASSKELTPGTVVKNSSGMEFAYVPAGSFQMGSDTRTTKEKPVHQVTIANGFYMGRYEVTEAQWQNITGNKPEFERGCGENCPVDGVSWNDVQEFIKKLNAANDGYIYRLPSEAEWEYAARAGTTGDISGDVDSIAWYSKNSNGKLHPVGQKKANAWGLYDMYGNAQEWVMDYSHVTYDGAPADGSAWLTGQNDDHRMKRGGSCNDDVEYLTHREQTSPDAKVLSNGFRVVAVPQSK